MTAGSNGDVHCYNYVTKSKIKSFYYGSPITAIKVHPSGKFFAFAVGNDWHLGTAGLNKWETKLGVH